MPFEITVSRDFSASHRLRLPGGALEPLHGHNWHVEVTAESDGLDEVGCVMDFHDLLRSLESAVGPMRTAHLNDLPAFGEGGLNPSAENVALHLYRALSEGLPRGVRLASASAWETPDCRATYRP